MQEETPGEPIDLRAYLARIGVQSPIAPDLQTLRAIITAHVATIPFENLDPFLGVSPTLDIESVQRKLVRYGRGGYCFEQNRLLSDALRAIGFNITDLAARVLWGQSENAITARSHMLLRVEIDGEVWIADAGFGGSTPTAPLRLTEGMEQATPHETYRLAYREPNWYLQVTIDGEWKPVYRFDLQPQYPIDYMVSNYWLSTRAESYFVASLTAARAPAGRRLALRNRQFTNHTTGGATTKRILATTSEIRMVLQHEFLIRLPTDPKLDEMLDRLPE
ncbi:MAG TPA: arylamine N-acetyltransferase [Rhodanobacteraceae bacterium]|nr:arylamine N-acetyltransferase [Rhodanobacteraceae bacterium]